MRRKRNRTALLLLLSVLLPCLLSAQEIEPFWTNSDVRQLKYSPDRYYTGFATTFQGRNERRDNAVQRVKQAALAELVERIRVTVNSRKQATIISDMRGNMDEKIRSIFTAAVATEAHAEVAGSKIESWYNRQTREISAFAFVKKEDLAAYYRNGVEMNLGKSEQTLLLSLDLLEKREKGRANRMCHEAIRLWGKAVYAQEMLSVIDPGSSERDLQQNRSSDLHSRLIKLLAELANSISIYIDCENEMIADLLPGLLAEEGCNCMFTENAGDAAYIVTVSAKVGRSNNAEGGMVFCYIRGTLKIEDVERMRTVKPALEEVKSGNITYKAALQKGYEMLAGDVARQIMQTVQ